MSKKKENKPKEDIKREPWIQKNKGVRIVMAASAALALWVGYQIIRTEGNWGKGILWGLLFGASIFLVYYGMNAFHRLFNKNNDKEE